MLIIVAVPHFDYQDEKSAVRSWMFQIKTAFEEQGAEVFFADHFKGKVAKSVSQEKKTGFVEMIKSILKAWPWFYYSLVYRQYFKQQDQLENEVLSTFEDLDLVIEFHTVGSEIGLKLAKKCNAQFSVIWDSPIDEQFIEMHNTKTAFWKRVVESEKNSLEAANKIMVYSQACEDFIKSKYDITAEVNKLPSSLNKPIEKIQHKDDGYFNIGFIGSFLSWHKLDMLVEVFESFHQKYNDARLILLGFGEEWHRIKEQAAKTNCKDAIEIPGFVSEEELVDYKSRFTIATMPGSNWYGSPLKLFEYSRAGLPFIAPVSKTVSYIYTEGEHCLFVKEEDEKGSLFDALEKMYLDQELRERLGKQAQQMIEDRYNKEAYYQRLIENLG